MEQAQPKASALPGRVRGPTPPGEKTGTLAPIRRAHGFGFQPRRKIAQMMRLARNQRAKLFKGAPHDVGAIILLKCIDESASFANVDPSFSEISLFSSLNAFVVADGKQL